MARRSSLVWRLELVCAGLVAVGVGVAMLLVDWLGAGWLAAAIAIAVMVPVTLVVVLGALGPMTAMFRALAGTVTSYRDGDFAFSLAWKPNDELGDLVAAHNALGDTLRAQREGL